MPVPQEREWEFQVAGFAGNILRAVAGIIGARVTSWKRTEERNAEVGGSPTSLHLVGGAVDVGKETTGWRLGAMQVFAAGRKEDGLHQKGTGVHYHFSAGEKTILVAGCVGLLLLTILRKVVG